MNKMTVYHGLKLVSISTRETRWLQWATLPAENTNTWRVHRRLVPGHTARPGHLVVSLFVVGNGLTLLDKLQRYSYSICAEENGLFIEASASGKKGSSWMCRAAAVIALFASGAISRLALSIAGDPGISSAVVEITIVDPAVAAAEGGLAALLQRLDATHRCVARSDYN